jgi:AraC-like DNA-binding protein
MATELAIKGMVCQRCMVVIRQEAQKLNLSVRHISLGRLAVEEALPDTLLSELISALQGLGFGVVSSRHTRLISQIREFINRHLDAMPQARKERLSVLLAEEFHLNYDSLSHLFSTHEGITIEQYFMQRRLEKVKEQLVYTDHTLTAIAQRLGFSSVNHLSSQFKEMTGLPPTYFRSIRFQKDSLAKK